MGERFGKRWLDEYGPKPTRAWEEAVRPWDASVISGALEMMGEKGWQHPPTLPQFQALLRDADRKYAKPADDWVRGYWRTVIVHEATSAAHEYRGIRNFEGYLVAHRNTIGAELRRLLDEVETTDKARGKRTDEDIRYCMERTRMILLDHFSLPTSEAA